MIKNYVKVFVMLYTMVMGFFFTFALVWRLLGNEITDLSISIMVVLSFIAEALYIHSIIEVKKDGN